MAETGSAIIFWHEHYNRVQHPFPVSFVDAISLADLRPIYPKSRLEEKNVCEATVSGRKYRCFVMALEPGRTLDDQILIVHHDRMDLEEQAHLYTAALRGEQEDGQSKEKEEGEQKEAGDDKAKILSEFEENAISLDEAERIQDDRTEMERRIPPKLLARMDAEC